MAIESSPVFAALLVLALLLVVAAVSFGLGARLGRRAWRGSPQRNAAVAAGTEDLARRADETEAADRAKNAFLANMSHEIRTPMNAILGLAHLLRRDSHDPVQQERADRVAGAARQLLDVLNDILDLSKIEAGRIRLEEVDFALDDLLSRVRAQVVSRARVKGLQLEVSSSGLPPCLRGDAARLSQALLHLLGNAIKFTEHGRVTLHVERLAEDADGVLARFTVEDTGVGVPPAHLPRLFDAFQQADTSTTRRFSGTGLGLAVTRHLAMLMGGDVGVESSLGVGSRFWFTARMRPAQGAPHAAPTDSALMPTSAAEAALRHRHGGARILVAEDNPASQQVAVELLRAAGLAVDVAADGVRAVELARRNAYDLVLMDVVMPVMDGIAAARQLREGPDAYRAPIVAMTAHAFGGDREACLQAGMNDYVSKPVEPRVLYEALLRWLPLRGDAVPATALPAAAQPLAVALDGILGLEPTQGLAHCGYQPALYARVLRSFVDFYGGRGAEEFRRRGDVAALGRAAHALRGVCGSVGAFELAGAAAALEGAVSAHHPDEAVAAAAAAIGERLGELVRALRDRLPAPADTPPRREDPEAAPALLERIAVLLAESDFSSAAAYRDAAPALRAAYGEDLLELERHLQNCDYEQALAALRRLQASNSRGKAPQVDAVDAMGST
ncbi:MAG TPA: response regulator [Burkholderiaceae bacterium]|nr:response regulator [Burkholderiaceae bacterium]